MNKSEERIPGGTISAVTKKLEYDQHVPDKAKRSVQLKGSELKEEKQH